MARRRRERQPRCTISILHRQFWFEWTEGDEVVKIGGALPFPQLFTTIPLQEGKDAIDRVKQSALKFDEEMGFDEVGLV